MLCESISDHENEPEDDEDSYLMSVGLAFTLGFEVFRNKFESLSDDQINELQNLISRYDNP